MVVCGVSCGSGCGGGRGGDKSVDEVVVFFKEKLNLIGWLPLSVLT